MIAGVCSRFIEKWKNLTDAAGSYEVDVWPDFWKLTAEVISRTAFGSSYEEGKKIFELQKELRKLVIEAIQALYIPGFRYPKNSNSI